MKNVLEFELHATSNTVSLFYMRDSCGYDQPGKTVYRMLKTYIKLQTGTKFTTIKSNNNGYCSSY